MEYHYQQNKTGIPNARLLRKNQTCAETVLWQKLRNRQLLGYKFRRQYPFDKYILDFCCLELKLVIELDGGQHAKEKQKQYDKQRTQLLEEKGFFVLRFWNTEMLTDTNAVLEKIVSCIKEITSP
mgnify:CR=1 FL=1